MLNLLPLAGSGRVMAHGDVQRMFVSQLLQKVLPGAVAPLLPPPSAQISNCPAWE